MRPCSWLRHRSWDWAFLPYVVWAYLARARLHSDHLLSGKVFTRASSTARSFCHVTIAPRYHCKPQHPQLCTSLSCRATSACRAGGAAV